MCHSRIPGLLTLTPLKTLPSLHLRAAGSVSLTSAGFLFVLFQIELQYLAIQPHLVQVCCCRAASWLLPGSGLVIDSGLVLDGRGGGAQWCSAE